MNSNEMGFSLTTLHSAALHTVCCLNSRVSLQCRFPLPPSRNVVNRITESLPWHCQQPPNWASQSPTGRNRMGHLGSVIFLHRSEFFLHSFSVSSVLFTSAICIPLSLVHYSTSTHHGELRQLQQGCISKMHRVHERPRVSRWRFCWCFLLRPRVPDD